MNIFSSKNDNDNDDVVKVEEPPSNSPTPVASPRMAGMKPLSDPDGMRPKEWFWTRWYKDYQTSVINDLVDRASRLGIDTVDLMSIENDKAFKNRITFLLYGTAAFLAVTSIYGSREPLRVITV